VGACFIKYSTFNKIHLSRIFIPLFQLPMEMLKSRNENCMCSQSLQKRDFFFISQLHFHCLKLTYSHMLISSDVTQESKISGTL